MKQLTITEWFARAVAVGLMPDVEGIYAEWSERDGFWELYIDNTLMQNIIICSDGKKSEQIQLRKDGKDLFELEWRKPTESDIGKMCWVRHYDRTIKLLLIENVRINSRVSFINSNSLYEIKDCLLADHGQIAPTEADFKRIYGEQL